MKYYATLEKVTSPIPYTVRVYKEGNSYPYSERDYLKLCFTRWGAKRYAKRIVNQLNATAAGPVEERIT